MSRWTSALRRDPLPPLLASANPALVYLVRRDLLGEEVGHPRGLWELKPVQRLLARQRPDGGWNYPGGGKPHHRAIEDYNQIETYRSLGELVEKYAATRELPAIRKAARFLFDRQTMEGDFRGIYGRQYTPNYTAAILELLVKAGYAQDRRVARAFRWLISVRQADGGWAVPISTRRARWDIPTLGGRTLQPDHSRPFSHMATGIVLRAFAAHPARKADPAALAGARLLAGRLFLRDTYPGRQTPDFWLRFTFPFWFTDLISALDSLTLLGLGPQAGSISKALDWLAKAQQDDGTWRLHILRGAGEPEPHLWIGLAIGRVFRRTYG